MKTKLSLKLIIITSASLFLFGCASYGGGYGYNQPYNGHNSSSYHYGDQVRHTRSNRAYNRVYGTVTSVQNIVLDKRQYNPALGIIAGAVVGGLVGHNIGDGTGQDIATIAGAVAGGAVGNHIQKSMSGTRIVKRINVRLDNGDYVSILQPTTNVWKGARVYITGSGNDARVVLKNR